MTDDTISRQAAIDVLNSHSGLFELYVPYEFYEVKQEFRKLPSVQPEIIRCKDCLMHGVCRFERGLGKDGYCSQAERRTYE